MAGSRNYDITPDATSKSVFVQLRSTTTNLWATGIAYTAVTAHMIRAGETVPAAITMSALASASAAFSAGGWVELIAGLYRFDPPDTAWASGSEIVSLRIDVAGTYGHLERFRIGTTALNATERTAIVQSWLDHDAGDGRLLKWALFRLLNKVVVNSGTTEVEIYDTDDTAIAHRFVYTDQPTGRFFTGFNRPGGS